MRKSVSRILLLGFLVVALWATGRPTLVLYDNFSASMINPSKWVGAQFYDPDLRETLRQVTSTKNGNRLHLVQRAYAVTTDDSASTEGVFGLGFLHPSAVKAISFQVMVNKISLVDCKTNSGIEVAGAEFRGSFFNTQASPTSEVGDVIADVGITQSVQQSTLTAMAFINECQDQHCGAQTSLFKQGLGTIAGGTTNTLLLQWDQPNHQFIFQLNQNTMVKAPYTVTDTTPPFFAYKNIDLARVVPHCTSMPRPNAFADAYLGNVYVNQ